ncbi:hypothetical protein JD844_019771 [Phrynosoma platyrhinos]|uniref:Transmembrane protein 238 n=1 Tax=Phrynosoma platyrhinos TaxID=52577 RepID=A0ABQ7TQF8_PHRPL|nr:hypothetical protein JD844_019771 [Phrynosoma platyrhinos]
MEGPRRLGRCQGAFWMALVFDAGGLALLLAGLFVDVYFSDLLVYGGWMGLLFSLLWWVFWYVGNLEVPPEELQDDVGLEGKAKARDLPPSPLPPSAPERRSRVSAFIHSLDVHFLGPRSPAVIRWAPRAASASAASVSSSFSSFNSLEEHSA